MSDLADFLLARIGDDEASMVGLPVQGDAPTWRWPSRARIYREAGARRRIIEAHYVVERAGQSHCDGCEQWAPCETLRLLALPYADHPDYQQEWRP